MQNRSAWLFNYRSKHENSHSGSDSKISFMNSTCIRFLWSKLYISRPNSKWAIIVDFLCSCLFLNWVRTAEPTAGVLQNCYRSFTIRCLFNRTLSFRRPSVVVTPEKNAKKTSTSKPPPSIVTPPSKTTPPRPAPKPKPSPKPKDSEVMGFRDNCRIHERTRPFILPYTFRGFSPPSDVARPV